MAGRTVTNVSLFFQDTNAGNSAVLRWSDEAQELVYMGRESIIVVDNVGPVCYLMRSCDKEPINVFPTLGRFLKTVFQGLENFDEQGERHVDPSEDHTDLETHRNAAPRFYEIHSLGRRCSSSDEDAGYGRAV